MIDDPEIWRARIADVIAAPTDKYEALARELEADWKHAYCEAFIIYAAVVRGWDEELAQGWAEDLVDEAYATRRNLWPGQLAQEDVRARELQIERREGLHDICRGAGAAGSLHGGVPQADDAHGP